MDVERQVLRQPFRDFLMSVFILFNTYLFIIVFYGNRNFV